MSIKSTLATAKARGELIRVHRGRDDAWDEGFVAAQGDDIFALQVIDKACQLDGFSCARYQGITECSPAPHIEFVQKAMRLRHEEPAELALDMSSFAALLTSAVKVFPLASIFLNGDDSVCYIGKVAAVGESELSLLEISPDAKWHATPTAFSLDEISRVDFGGRYEEILYLVAAVN